MRTIIMMMAAASAIALAGPAAAVQYRFDVVDTSDQATQGGVPFDGNTYFFFFDSSPQVDVSTTVSFSLTGSAFFSVGGMASDPVAGQFNFLTGNGGFSTPINSYFSEQLFTGDTATPTFLLGTFLTDVGFVTISQSGTPPTGPVPEPASWAMMIAGFGMIGAALRSRRTTVRFA